MDEIRARIVAMTKAGVFGPPGMWPYVRDNNGEHRLGLNFASEIEFFRIGLHRSASTEPEESEFKEISVVVKTQLRGLRERQFTNNDTMFFNEVYMYQTILPLIEAEDFFPKCFYAEACPGNNPTRDIVITEDRKPLGFIELSDVTLDLRCLKVALNTLGRFHGLSYKAKKTCSSFNSKVKVLKQIKFDDEFDSLILATVRRGIMPCFDAVTGEKRNILERFLEIMAAGREVLRRLKTPEEPFAVVCHGEFHKSNVLFKSEDERIESIFLDLQMSLFSDPSTDLSFMLYMNASQEIRNDHWNDLIHEYWGGVISVEPNPGFNFDTFIANFERKSIYGYLPTSIFLPLMLDNLDANESIDDFLSHPLNERIEIMGEIGGDQATEVLSKIVIDLLDRGHIGKFVNQYTNDE